jgi:hypothetical protein
VLIISLVVAVLAVARITRLLIEDRLTVSYRQFIVKRTGPNSLLTYLVHCPWCMSIWIAVPVMPVAALFPNPWVIGVLAIPAASMITGMLLDRGGE